MNPDLKKLYLALIFFNYLIINASAQEIMDGELSRKMDMAVALMDHGSYESADKLLFEVMQGLETLPSEIAYYFGRNSFHIKKYKQSINWLNKYIQLKGTKGRFYEPAVRYLQLAEEEFLIISRQKTQKLAIELSGGNYDCGGLEKMICPVCHGNGVIIKKGPFDARFQTCPYSLGESYLSCEEYNQFMRGELSPKTD
ncbi:MAG: hypothetical protein RIA69_03285 [Cyclobacteriaceae bacterium]